MNLIIATLAVYGISSLVTSYDGPYEVFLELRQKHPHSAFVCTVCLAVWMAVPIAIYAGVGILGYLAIIGIVIILEKVL